MSLQILIADDHGIFRHGLKQLLTEEFPEALIDEAESGKELLQKIRNQACNIIISDLSMPGINGLDMIKLVKNEFPELPILILSMHPESQYALRVMKAGANGYITKECASNELKKAVHQILSGRKYISTLFAQQLAENISQLTAGTLHDTLSDREFEVMKLIASGKAVTQIAEALSLSVPTISSYRARILEKTKLKNNAELTHYVITNGII